MKNVKILVAHNLNEIMITSYVLTLTAKYNFFKVKYTSYLEYK